MLETPLPFYWAASIILRFVVAKLARPDVDKKSMFRSYARIVAYSENFAHRLRSADDMGFNFNLCDMVEWFAAFPLSKGNDVADLVVWPEADLYHSGGEWRDGPIIC